MCPELILFGLIIVIWVECSLKEALFSLRKSKQTFVDLEPAIHQIEKLKGKLFRQMYECVRGNPGEWMTNNWIYNL